MSERFNALLQVRTPSDLVEAIDKAVGEDLSTRSDYVRKAVIDRLRSDGIDYARRPAVPA